MTGFVPRNKTKILIFVITLIGLYILTGLAGLGLLQPTPQPFYGTAGTGAALSAIEWWQYLLFGLYNIAVWVAAYLVARVVPNFFS